MSFKRWKEKGREIMMMNLWSFRRYRRRKRRWI